MTNPRPPGLECCPSSCRDTALDSLSTGRRADAAEGIDFGRRESELHEPFAALQLTFLFCAIGNTLKRKASIGEKG